MDSPPPPPMPPTPRDKQPLVSPVLPQLLFISLQVLRETFFELDLETVNGEGEGFQDLFGAWRKTGFEWKERKQCGQISE